MAHFLVVCWVFERDQLVLLDDMYRTEKAREWLDEFWLENEERKMVLEDICNREMVDVEECLLYWLGRCWQRRKQLF